jgi:peptidoglycan hydrolase-like amidase
MVKFKQSSSFMLPVMKKFFSSNVIWVMCYVFGVALFLLITHHSSLITIYADEVEDLQKQIDQLNEARKKSIAATKPLEGQLQSMKIQLTQIQNTLYLLSNKIIQKEQDLEVREQKVAEQQYLLETRVRNYYKRSYLNSPLAILMSSQHSAGLLRELFYRQVTTNEDQKVISSITGDIVSLVFDRDKLQKDKKALAVIQAEVDQQATFLGGEIKKAEAYQKDLTKQIADLTAKQQAILAAKSGDFTTSVGNVPLADDPNARPTFNPGFSPAFAAFSFGAYTHRNGMSQYGAKGRAESGQSAEDILKAYYPGASLNKGYSMPATINVDGYGSKNFEDEYLIGIYEMPSSFPMEALKAQAVAARTYAVRRGGSICATESCQVFKPAPGRSDAWVEAVKATRGWVLEGGANAQYSSTTGGYGNNSGWDTKCGSRDCWTGDAYEKIAGSPWFYKGWYKDRSGSSCGRSHPWLNNEEMSDILNSWIVYQSGDGHDRISPVDTSCWPGNPLSIVEMRNKAGQHGGAVTTVSGVTVTYSNNGSTSNVVFTTNRGTMTISGSDFKTIFNLRAPGYVSIKSPLFNMESK